MKRGTIYLIAIPLLTVAATAAWRSIGARREPVAAPAPAIAGRAARATERPGQAATGGAAAAPAWERTERLALEIDRALAAHDPQQRETAFNALLPELLDTDAARVVALVARQAPGESRDALRDEVARQWVTKDRDAAVEWLNSLDEAERRASATTAMRALVSHSREAAIHLADEFDIGRNDGYLEHVAQIWATEDLEAATRWVQAQPEGPRTAQLRARIDAVRTQQAAAQAGSDLH